MNLACSEPARITHCLANFIRYHLSWLKTLSWKVSHVAKPSARSGLDRLLQYVLL